MPTREVCDAAREFGLPVIVDVAGKAHVIDMFAPEYPDDDRFIVAHIGSFADDWRAHERVVEQMAPLSQRIGRYVGRPAVRLSRAGDQTRGTEQAASGARTGPWLHPELELHKIRLLGLSRRAQALVLGGNARAACSSTEKQRMSGVNWRQPERIVTTSASCWSYDAPTSEA